MKTVKLNNKKAKISVRKRGGIRANAGRPPGSTNRDLRPLREMLEALISANFEQLTIDLARLPSMSRVDALIRLMEFCVPNLQRLNSLAQAETGPAPVVIQVESPEKARATARLLADIDEKMNAIDREFEERNNPGNIVEEGTIEDFLREKTNEN